MSFSINLGSWNSVFAVPCSVVDDHLKLAGSVQLKVLLWVLRHAGEPFETQNIADALGIDRADVSDAMVYWQETGLVTADGSRLSPAPVRESGSTQLDSVPFQPQEKSSPATASQNPPAEEKKRHVLPRPQKPDSSFVAKRMAESQEIACLMQSAQEILGRLISSGDSAALLMIHDDYGLPSDVIIMLMQYAVSIGKGSMRYIEKVAMNWADEGIDSHEKAEDRLRVLSENQKAWHTVEQAINIQHRTPSKREESFAPVWVNEWKFTPEMIREAYDRTIDSTGKYQAGYMNSILERWHKSGISTTKQAADDQIERAAARKPSKFGGTKQQPAVPEKELTFDIDEYERTSIYDTKR